MLVFGVYFRTVLVALVLKVIEVNILMRGFSCIFKSLCKLEYCLRASGIQWPGGHD